MAKQTINIGTSPNDGTGTPLRTAFDYCNLNFTELYTAVGPSGNNIVCPGSATITGDLTVDTSTLKVDSTNDRVGIGTATPAAKLIVRDGSNRNLLVSSDATQLGSAGIAIGSFTDNAAGYAPLSIIAGTSMAFGMNGTTAMTLNSTGLAIGDTAFSGTRLTLRESATNPNALAMTNRNATQTWRIGVDVAAVDDKILGFYDSTSATFRMQLTDTGNLGIGVTPSAWGSNYKALQIGAQSCFYNALGYITSINTNAFENSSGQIVRIANGEATRYVQSGGVHQWFYAANAIAGTVGGFTQAMTLDASGNLLVGTTSALASGSTFQNLGASRQVLTLKGDAFGSYTAGVWNASTTNDGLFVYFGTEATLTVRGGISYNRAGGLVAYNTTSDYRAKDIIGPVSNSGSLIDSLKVYVGKMKGATIERPMLIAHEAQEVAPYAVTGVKDEVDSDGKDKYQQMDVSSFVPLLIAEIQSLRTRVQTLEAR
jgi:hypothetical protein